ncbi:MAG: epoxyqueuosine reductase QueH [Synergistaceae bacterium]|jgi:predicted adenine nucleotide alpha hydrolase (AANH) superfamily ATPase|nr:epoxyqueuosine reductase QueH [Synergistaceae bacterium]
MKERVLLHVCCAPDATVPWPALRNEGYEVDAFFYGSNIHPEGEWARRADALRMLSQRLGGKSEFAPYEPDAWFDATSGMEGEPEGGARCAACFGIQLAASAAYAASLGYGRLCTTLSISPHKSPELINSIGASVAKNAGIAWIERVWRKNDGFKLSIARSGEMGLYRQNYCGCAHSVRRFEPVSAL